MLKSQFIKVFAAHFCFLALIARACSQNNKVMGEVRLGATPRLKEFRVFGSMADTLGT
jgi:hypothetical protein